MENSNVPPGVKKLLTQSEQLMQRSQEVIRSSNELLRQLKALHTKTDRLFKQISQQDTEQ
jgi:hypothetical protein